MNSYTKVYFYNITGLSQNKYSLLEYALFCDSPVLFIINIPDYYFYIFTLFR